MKQFPVTHLSLMNRFFLFIFTPLLLFLSTHSQLQAAEKVILQLRWDHQFQFAGFYAAQWQGYYQENGIEVEIKSAIRPDNSIVSAIEEVAAERAHFGIGAADILVAMDQGKPLVILASIFQQSAVEFYAPKRVGLHKPADLVNLRVSRRPGDMTDVELQAMLLAEGIDPNSVQVHSFDQSRGYLAQVKAGNVDVVPGYSIGTPHEARQLGIALDRLRPGDYGVDFYGDSLFTNEQMISKKPELVEKFIIASMQGWEYALQHPEEISRRIIESFTPKFPLRNYTSFVHSQIEPVRELTLFPVIHVGNVNPARWRRMHETLKQLNIVKGAFRPEKAIFDPLEFKRLKRERLKNIFLVAGIFFLLVIAVGSLWIIALRHTVRERTKTLRSKEEQYRNLVEWSPAILYSFLPEHGGIYYSPQVSLLGYTSAELEAKPMLWHDSIHPDDISAINAAIEKAKHGKSLEVQYRIRHKDGHWIWLLDRTCSRSLPDGRVVLEGVAMDITGVKIAEEALKESEEKWRNILVNTPQIGITLNPQAKITFANQHFLKLTGWEEHEILGQDWFAMFIPESRREEIRHVFSVNMAPGFERALKFSNYENEIMTKSGELIDVAWSNLLTRDLRGRAVDITCLGIDITERKRWEALLEKRNTDLKLAQRIASIGNWSFDPEIGVPEWSEEVYRIYERDPDLGPFALADYQSVYKAEWLECFQSSIQSAINDGIPYDIELRIELPSGAKKWIHAIAEPEAERGPKGHKLRGTIQDITELKEAEEALRQSHKMEAIGTLAGGIAHEFNNMLTIIIGNAELAIDDIPAGNPAVKSVEEIRIASFRARDVVRQLLRVARKAPESREIIVIRDVVGEALGLLRKTIPSSIEITTTFRCTTEMMLADPTEIHQVVINLCNNGVHAMAKDKGLLEVALTTVDIDGKSSTVDNDLQPGKYAKLTVADNGCGMKEDILDRVFEPYFTTKDIDEGLGMGLAVVHGIVKKYEGAISITSEVGKGTEVEVLFPLVEGDEVVNADAGDISPSRKERILVIDDEPSLAEITGLMLERLGYEVVRKISSGEALREFAAAPECFDLVFTDMTMPDMTGDELAEKIIQIRPDIPVILCTGHSKHVDEQKAEKLGIRGFAMKPLTQAELAKVVRQALDDSGNESGAN